VVFNEFTKIKTKKLRHLELVAEVYQELNILEIVNSRIEK